MGAQFSDGRKSSKGKRPPQRGSSSSRRDQTPISAAAAAAKPWESTRMWLQRSLSLATIHMLRDGLWSLARTQGLNQEQHTQLQLHIVKTLATDIDASLEELLKFDDDFDQESMRLHFFQYMLGFYGQRCQRSNDGNASIVPLAQFQCSGERLLIATANQALDVTFVEQNKIKLVLWRRCSGVPIRAPELKLIRSFIFQLGGWLWNESSRCVGI